MIAVTGASGQLGHLVIQSLLATVPASEIVAMARTVERAADLAALGVAVRQADYTLPATMEAAFQGCEKVLLISSSEIGARVGQHKNAIDAAKKAGVSLIAYTSVLRADTSPLGLAGEHVATERHLSNSGVPFALLRNGWYTENYLLAVPAALQHGTFVGCAGQGRIASAARADYAAAAAAVLTKPGQVGKVYELAGDDSYTLAQFAATLSRLSGRQIPYLDMPQAEYRQALVGAGLPEPLADLLSDSDAGAAKGALFDEQRQLSALIGRPTATLESMIAQALA